MERRVWKPKISAEAASSRLAAAAGSGTTYAICQVPSVSFCVLYV